MSRTRKDKPFWVRLNQEAKYTDHDHRHLGRVEYRREYVKDEDGNQVYEEVPVGCTADQALYELHYSPTGQFYYTGSYYNNNYDKVPAFVYKRAKELHAAGRGDEFIQWGTKPKAVTRVVEVQTPDHCTEGEPIKRGTSRWGYWRDMPCTPDLGHEGYWWRYGESKVRQSYLKMWHGHDRTRTNATLRNMTKAANMGRDDWEDDFQEIEELTEPYKNGMAWWIH